MRPVTKCRQRTRPPAGRSECLLARISSPSHMKAHGRPRPDRPGERLRPLEPRPRPPVSHYADRPLSQGQALSARPDRPKRTRPTHCAWILHALRFAGAGTYRPRWTALPRKASPAKFSSLPQGKAPALARHGSRNPSACAIPAPARNQRTTLQDCSRQRFSRTLTCSTSTYCYIPPLIFAPTQRHGPGSFESWS